MTAPLPLVFQPLPQPRPWGGRALATLLGKPLPPDVPIGETWELASLPGAETCVRDGPLAGTPLGTLVERWDTDLLGAAPRCDGRFPLLIKFLDARETLSVQVHPRPPVARDVAQVAAAARGATQPAGIKHEAWYIVHAEPGSHLYVGLRPGVTRDDVAAAMRTAAPCWDEFLQSWPAVAGDCFHLPSGTPHALGAGVVVAEVQTPSDVTYRLHDWGRVGLDGRPRPLHVAEALANLRDDVAPDTLHPTPQRTTGSFGPATRLVTAERFIIDCVDWSAAGARPVAVAEMRVWIVLAGAGEVAYAAGACRFRKGDVVLLPAAVGNAELRLSSPGTLLEVRVPAERR
jgi:mannose-6-phosphate isomerase